jgi:DNA-binding transcriptional regulator GbsR (MarR family)
MNDNFQERILTILQESPNGLTSNQIAERLGVTAGNISSRLSKLAAYGIIRKSCRGPKGNVYRPLTDEQPALKISNNLLALADEVIK